MKVGSGWDPQTGSKNRLRRLAMVLARPQERGINESRISDVFDKDNAREKES